MAWASGNKRWTLPFVSLNGTECRVDIYKKGYTGSTVDTLIGSATPIEWQEDDDEDLLNVVRVKTGSLNVIEQNYGDLQELYPAVSTDHYIEVYYGKVYDEETGEELYDKLIFTGFMQAQTFENDWTAGPRELSFNITSPLGIVDGLLFSKPTIPDYKMLGTIMRTVIDGLNANIQGVTVPVPDTGVRKNMFAMYLCSNVITPEDQPYKYQMSASDLFSQRSYRDFIEGLCNCFGMIVHDEPGQLVFSRFDYDGNYLYVNRYRLADGTNIAGAETSGATTADLNDTIEVASADNTESLVLPMNKVEIKYDGGFFRSASVPFDHCNKRTTGGSGFNWDEANIIPLNDEVTADNLKTNAYLTSNGHLSEPGVVFKYAGEKNSGGSEMILIQKGTGWETGVPKIVKWTLFDRPQQSFRISFDGKWGPSIANLNSEGTAPTIHVWIKCGDRYYGGSSGDYSWQTTAVSCDASFGDITIGVNSTDAIGRGRPIEIWMTTDLQYLSADNIYCIQNLKVEANTSAILDYVYGDNDSDIAIIAGAASEVSTSVDVLFTNRSMTANYLSDRGTAAKLPDNNYYNMYKYMIQSQNRLQVKVKGTIPDYAYLKKIIYFNSSWRWRLIAIGFDPREDNYTLTLHRSPIIE